MGWASVTSSVEGFLKTHAGDVLNNSLSCCKVHPRLGAADHAHHVK